MNTAINGGKKIVNKEVEVCLIRNKAKNRNFEMFHSSGEQCLPAKYNL